jgi:hypothetical protein
MELPPGIEARSLQMGIAERRQRLFIIRRLIMSRRILAVAVFSTLVLSAAACNSPLESLPGQASATQGAGSPFADDKGGQRPAGVSDDSLPHVSGGADDPANHDVGDDRGVDDPATHDVGDDRGADDPATHDVGDDRGGSGRGRGGADDPANHE